MGTLAEVKGIFTKDLSYKVVALLITLLIWLLVLGRGHETQDINLKVDFSNVAPSLSIVEASYDVVKVKVKGPPKLIRKFILANSALKLEQPILKDGVRRIRVNPKNLALPYGLRVLSISPREIRLVVRDKVGEENGR